MFDPLIHYAQRQRKLSLTLALAAAIGVMAISEIAHTVAVESLSRVRASHQARYNMLLLRTLLTDAETAQRGYLLTDRPSYLEPLTAAKLEVPAITARISQLYMDSEWERLSKELQAAVDAKFSELNETIALKQAGSQNAWLEITKADIGKEKMDAVRLVTAQFEKIEQERINADRIAIFSALDFGRYGVHALTVLILLWFFYFVRKSDSIHTMQEMHSAALQVERDRLEGEVLSRTDELTELARHLTGIREDERARLARELHDELGALLTAAKLDIARARRLVAATAPDVDERLRHMGALIDEGITLKRRIIEDLVPSALSNLGLVAALDILAQEFAARSGLQIHAQLSDVAANASAKLALYRLVQEALVNVHRHANAKHVWIALRAGSADKAMLTVHDDGVGFDVAAKRTGHHGLLGMRYRIEGLGGRLEIQSRRGEGTQITAYLPFAVLDSDDDDAESDAFGDDATNLSEASTFASTTKG